MDAIVTKNLRKEYRDVVALEGLDLTVTRGELFSLLGVNGAGKSTTIRMLCGLTAPTGGNAWLKGKSILTDRAAIKSIIALSPQETAVAPGLTVRENLALMAGLHGFSREKCARRVEEMLAQFDLTGIAGKKAGRLSGGWQRRLSIAMALISEPEILFLDEPTLGLDVLARRELWDTIRTLKGTITIILTTHYMEEAEALSDRVGILKDGRLLGCDTPENIKKVTGTDSFEQAFVQIVRGAER